MIKAKYVLMYIKNQDLNVPFPFLPHSIFTFLKFPL